MNAPSQTPTSPSCIGESYAFGCGPCCVAPAAAKLTGMSGTGNSKALLELAQRGFEVVDTDTGGWTAWSDADDATQPVERIVDRLIEIGRSG